MISRILLAAFSLVACFAQARPADIENLDKAWSKAILAKDSATLERLLDNDLVYAHASGAVDSKQQYLDKIKSGRQVYKSFEQRKVSVRMHGHTAVTQSWARVTGVNPQGPFDDKIMLLHVWMKKNGAWRLVAHQTARVDALP
ncbi:MAG: nuclear transport factor 2 family protein [Bryobacteraceae bacterium]